jgi:hypothetical protein
MVLINRLKTPSGFSFHACVTQVTNIVNITLVNNSTINKKIGGVTHLFIKRYMKLPYLMQQFDNHFILIFRES